MHDDSRHGPDGPLVITISERATGRYEARHGQVLLCRSAQPLLDGARALLAMGCDPSAVLAMRRQGSNLDDLRTRIGVAAGLTVDETNTRFARWKPRISQIGQTSIAPFGPPASPLAAGPFHRAREALA